MKETLVQQCLDVLKRDDIKYELKCISQPVVDLAFLAIKPYIYLTMGIILSIFGMILAIFILLIFVLRSKRYLP